MKKKFTITESQVITTTHIWTYDVEAESYEDALQSVQDGEEEATAYRTEDDEFGEQVYELTGVEEFTNSNY